MVAANSRIREALTLRARVSIEVCHLTGFKHVFFSEKGVGFQKNFLEKKHEKNDTSHIFCLDQKDEERCMDGMHSPTFSTFHFGDLTQLCWITHRDGFSCCSITAK